MWQNGRAAVASGRYPWVVFGLEPGEPAQLFCEVRFRPKDIEARQTIFDLARAHQLDQRWRLESGVHPRLRITSAETGDIDIHDAGVQIVAWLKELADSTVLHNIPRFRKRDPLIIDVAKTG